MVYSYLLMVHIPWRIAFGYHYQPGKEAAGIYKDNLKAELPLKKGGADLASG